MNYVTYEVRDRVANIKLNRPEKRNAFDAQLVEELGLAFQRAADDEQAKVIRLCAEGKAFCAGADLGYIQAMQAYTPEENRHDSATLAKLYRFIYTHPKVVVAQVQGHALAGGCGLATVCDFTLAAEQALFGYTEVKIGFIPAIVLVFLLRKMGETRAKDLLLSGRLISAQEALQYGLIHEVLPLDQLETRCDALLESLVKGTSGDSLRLTKAMIAEVQNFSLDEGLDYAASMNALARATPDCKRGIAAFLNKETLVW